MLKSEQEPNTLYESFIDRSSVEKQITFQNKVISIGLIVLLIGAVAILCLLLL